MMMPELLYFFRKIYLTGSNLLDSLVVQAAAVDAVDENIVLGIDMSIEGLRAQKYSVGIFIFLIVSLVFFSMIIYFYMPRGKDGKKLKRGEKIMFGCIIAGVFIAIAIGWMQLIDGYLI